MFDRILHHEPHPVASRERRTLARGLQRVIDDATRPRPAHGLYPVVRHDVAVACCPSLIELAMMLRDPARDIDADILARVSRLLLDVDASPLFGDRPELALLEAAELEARARGAFGAPAAPGDRARERVRHA